MSIVYEIDPIYDSKGVEITPKYTEVELISSPIRNIYTGIWEFPVFRFNPLIYNPFLGEIDILNEDIHYQEKTISYFYAALSERWLHRKDTFKKLLDFFRISKSGNEATVSLVSDPEKNKDRKLTDAEIRHIFKYIENKFATRNFVEKTLREYVVKHKVKWYDLYNNKDNVKELFSRKLKKKIKNSIDAIRYENK